MKNDELQQPITKKDFLEDEIIVILKRLDQARLFTLEWIRRLEGEVELIKKHVGLV